MAKKRFQAQPQTIQRELVTIIKKMGATSLKINQDVFEGTAEIIFDRAGRRPSGRHASAGMLSAARNTRTRSIT